MPYYTDVLLENQFWQFIHYVTVFIFLNKYTELVIRLPVVTVFLSFLRNSIDVKPVNN